MLKYYDIENVPGSLRASFLQAFFFVRKFLPPKVIMYKSATQQVLRKGSIVGFIKNKIVNLQIVNQKIEWQF